MRLRKILFFVISVFIVVYAVYICSQRAAGKEAAGIKKDTTEDSSLDSSNEQVRSFTLSGFSETGRKTWELRGKSADILSDVINLSDVDADSYGEKVKVNLKADEGVYSKNSKDIKLKKNVVLVTDEGTTLTTDSLIWHAKYERISTDAYVYIKREDMDIEGRGSSARPNLKKAQLNEDVRLDIKKPPSVITCDGPLKIDYGKNIAYFFDNVELNDKETKINADKATAYFDPKKRVLTKVFCRGNVKILRGKDTSYSQELTYLPEEGRVILGGRPKILISETSDLMEKAEDGKNEPTKNRKPD